MDVMEKKVMVWKEAVDESVLRKSDGEKVDGMKISGGEKWMNTKKVMDGWKLEKGSWSNKEEVLGVVGRGEKVNRSSKEIVGGSEGEKVVK